MGNSGGRGRKGTLQTNPSLDSFALAREEGDATQDNFRQRPSEDYRLSSIGYNGAFNVFQSMNESAGSAQRCGFCGKARHEVKLLFTGDTTHICDSCIRGYQALLTQVEKKSLGSDQQGPLPETISIEDFWFLNGCPQPPDTFIADGFTEQQADELMRALEIVRMLQRIQGKGWNERSVNARAQRRWPDAKFVIEDIDAIQSNWFRLGVPGLIAMIERGRSDFYSMRKVCYHPIFHDVTNMTAVVAPREPTKPIFIGTGTMSKFQFHPEEVARVYSVGLESQFGRYQFNMVNHGPPAPPEASAFACLHTKVG